MRFSSVPVEQKKIEKCSFLTDYFRRSHFKNPSNMTHGVRQEIDKILQQAHHIMMEVDHKDATKEERRKAKDDCKVLYNQIKLLDTYTYHLVTATLADD